jgi:hypothetical protein
VKIHKADLHSVSDIPGKIDTYLFTKAGLPMYHSLQSTTASFLITMMFLFVGGCSQEKTPSFYNPTATSLPNPTITSVTPVGSAVAGIDTITVKGTGFSTTLSDNFVVFNSQSAQLVQATPTEIKLIAPLLVTDSIALRVSVHGSFEFSNKIQYALKPAVAVFGDLTSIELSSAVAIDASGNVYSGYSLNGIEAGLLKFDGSGVRTVYAPKTGGDWTGLKMGPGGYLYAVRNTRAVYRYAPGGGALAAVWLQVTGTTFFDCDFDQNGNLWAGGNNTSIYRFASDKSVVAVPFVGNVHAVRVFAGYLYFAAKTDAGEKIWRAQITTDGFGTPEVYFDFATAFPTLIPQTMTFSSDGDLYVGLNSSDGVLIVTPQKNYYRPLTVYSKLFGKGVDVITWGKTNDLYCSTTDGLLLKINVTGKKSAPYYGITL